MSAVRALGVFSALSGALCAWAMSWARRAWELGCRLYRLCQTTCCRAQGCQANGWRLSVVYANPEIRNEIYRARHRVYAEELGQYPTNTQKTLRDDTDDYNAYIVAQHGYTRVLQGFIAVTPAGRPKGMERHGVTPLHTTSVEFRLLTVLPGGRGKGVAGALMHAAARYAQSCGATHAEAMAREELVPMYARRGMRTVTDVVVKVGTVRYVHMHAPLCDLHHPSTHPGPSTPTPVQWELPCLPEAPRRACFHGGAGQESLDPQGIQADVLDAWFDPAPGVVRAVATHTQDIRITPPTQCDDLRHALCAARGLDPATLLFGCGSSDLIYRCFWAWLTPESRVLLLDPCYAEYAHVLASIGCRVTRLPLSAETGYTLSPGDVQNIQNFQNEPFDLVVLVNPNSPTGVHSDLAPVIARFPARTKVWVDETYVDYTHHAPLERLVQTHPNLVVCKSLSKTLALSGLRAGYVCASPAVLEGIAARTPPWQVSRVAQRAVVAALRDPEYYQNKYAETHVLRHQLARFLVGRGWEVVAGSCANFVMAHPPCDAVALVDECARSRLFIRSIDSRTVRVAVKDAETQSRMLRIIAEAENSCARGSASDDDDVAYATW